MTETAHCYCRRLLSPFRGLQAVIEQGSCRALSTDGMNWTLEVRSDRPQQAWGRMERQEQQAPYFRYALYSEQAGLRCFPLNPLLKLEQLDHWAKGLISVIRSAQGWPYPLEDAFELWLLDSEQQPLALLQSSCELAATQSFRANRWIAAEQNDTGFISPSLQQTQTPARQNHRDWLTQHIRQAGGQPLQSVWFVRQSLWHHPPPQGFELRGDLPTLLLKSAWTDPLMQAVVDDYHAWLAPQLLQLPYLTNAQQQTLQSAALPQARQVERLHRLYPADIDQHFIATARVAAQLQQSA